MEPSFLPHCNGVKTTFNRIHNMQAPFADMLYTN